MRAILTLAASALILSACASPHASDMAGASGMGQTAASSPYDVQARNSGTALGRSNMSALEYMHWCQDYGHSLGC